MGTNKHGLKPRQAAAMSKSKRSRLRWVNMQPIYKAIANKWRQRKIDDGDVIIQKNPKGNEYYWYRKGRKVCLSTGLKLDPDGFPKNAHQSYQPIFTKKLLQRINK